MLIKSNLWQYLIIGACALWLFIAIYIINVKKTIVIPKYDNETLEAVKNFHCEIVHQKGEGFGSALIEGIATVKTKFLCIFI